MESYKIEGLINTAKKHWYSLKPSKWYYRVYYRNEPAVFEFPLQHVPDLRTYEQRHPYRSRFRDFAPAAVQAGASALQ